MPTIRTFTGKELFCWQYVKLHKVTMEQAEEVWDKFTGRSDQESWKELAVIVNRRIDDAIIEVSRI